MANEKLTAQPALTTPAADDVMYIVDVSAGTGTSKQIVVSDLTTVISAVTSVNGAVGVVSLGLQDLDDVSGVAPSTGDVVSYTAGTWVLNSGLQNLLARFKASGTGAQIYDTLNDTTKGFIDVQSTSSKMAVDLTSFAVSQTSPGTLSFSVAAGGAGVETEYLAAQIVGSTTAGNASLLLRSGLTAKFENSSGFNASLINNTGAAADRLIQLPATAGTLALTTDIPSVPVVNTQSVNRLVACSAVTDTLDGEANLTFNGSELTVTGDITTTGAVSGSGSSLKVGKLDTQVGAAGSAGDMGLNAEIYTAYTTTVVAGAFYALDATAWIYSNATSIGTSAKGMIGMATSTGSGTGMVIRGICYVATDPAGAIGDVVYLSAVNGRLTTTPVSTTGNISRVMGYKIGTNLVFLNPSQDWIEIS